MLRDRPFLIGMALALWTISAGNSLALETAFTYQGQLKSSGVVAGGDHDFEFRLYDADGGGGQVGSTVALNSVPVNNGLFTVTLDFGASAFDGSARWLEIAVRPSGGGAFTTLAPRQKLTATPYAVRSKASEDAEGLRGTPVSASAPTSGQVLQFGGTQWGPATMATVPSGAIFFADSPSAPTGYTCLGLSQWCFSDNMSWRLRADLPTWRVHSAAVGLNGKVYIFSGAGASLELSTQAYDPVTNTWATKAQMPSSLMNHAAVEHGGNVYIFGSTNTGTGVTYMYNPGTDAWTTKTALGNSRTHMCAASVAGKIYVFGGDDGVDPLKDNHEYNPATDTWTVKAQMTYRRLHFCGVAVNGKVYAIGGFGGITGPDYADLSSVEEYDPAANSWTAKANMPTARSGLAAGVIADRVYVFGGYDAPDRMTVTEIFDPADNGWTTGVAMPVGRSAHTAASLHGGIYVLGGQPEESVGSRNEWFGPPYSWAWKKD
jgi:N-acetylneuraminic acid mutarotase